MTTGALSLSLDESGVSTWAWQSKNDSKTPSEMTFLYPPVSISGGGNVDFYGVGQDHSCYTMSFTLNGEADPPQWNGDTSWTSIGASFNSNVSVVGHRWSLDVFGLGTDETIKLVSYRQSMWKSAKTLTSQKFTSGPTALVTGRNTVDVVALGTDGKVYCMKITFSDDEMRMENDTFTTMGPWVAM